MAVSFDLFGTLVAHDRPEEPWDAAAAALSERGVQMPPDEEWERAYRTAHVDLPRGAEGSLVAHVRAALESCGTTAADETVQTALLAAFDGPVAVSEGATEAIEAARETGPVGICSNCSLPGLVDRVLARADLPAVDAVVTSVDCGWRKPHDRAFEATADALGVAVEDLVHVGDDPRTDGGGRTAGTTVLLTEEVSLAEVPAWLEEHR